MRREGRLSPPVPVVHALAQIVFAREPRVHAATRPSLRPLPFEEGERRCKARAIAVARIPTRDFPVMYGRPPLGKGFFVFRQTDRERSCIRPRDAAIDRGP